MIVAWMKWVGAMLGKRAIVDRIVGSLAVDIAPLQQDLCWGLPYTMQAGLAATDKWYHKIRVSL